MNGSADTRDTPLGIHAIKVLSFQNLFLILEIIALYLYKSHFHIFLFIFLPSAEVLDITKIKLKNVLLFISKRSDPFIEL